MVPWYIKATSFFTTSKKQIQCECKQHMKTGMPILETDKQSATAVQHDITTH